MRDGEKGQLGLFTPEGPSEAREDRRLAEQLGQEHAAGAALAARLPPGVRFGTSSWSFPGWKGLVWPRRTTTAVLSRESRHAVRR